MVWDLLMVLISAAYYYGQESWLKREQLDWVEDPVISYLESLLFLAL
jgi:hypothetical protein